jgi:hypothetical protein
MIDDAYWLPDEHHHAFALLRDGGQSRNLTAWAAVGAMFGFYGDEQAEGTLQKLAAGDVATDWGARMLSSSSPLYDPLHYNSGTVWPFVTGFVGLGQYRYRRPWSGFPFIQAMQRLTFDWALGRHPELLSGRFYSPLDETVPHQFFASSALPSMFLRGTLGWAPDAAAAKARLAPQLPPAWPRVAVRNLAVGGERLDVLLERGGGSAQLELTGSEAVELEWVCSVPAGARNVRATLNGSPIPVSVVEGTHDGTATLVFPRGGATGTGTVTWDGGLEVDPPSVTVRAGEESRGVRVLDFGGSSDGWRLRLEGPAGSAAEIGVIGESVRVAGVETRSSGADPAGAATVAHRDPETGRTTIRLEFPGGPGRSWLELGLVAAD